MFERQRGQVPLYLLVLSLLAAAAGLFIAAIYKSRSIESDEDAAVDRLLDIAAAVSEWEGAATESKGPAFLRDLCLGARRDWASGLVTPKGRGDLQRAVLVRGGYCFALFRCDGKGNAFAEAPPQPTDWAPGFWVAYAWPEKWGESGRRLFVLDSAGSLRFYEHSNRMLSGPDQVPEPWLAQPMGQEKYPFAKKPGGWQKNLTWQEIRTP